MVGVGDLIAGAALLLSAYATWRAHRVSSRQERVLELEEKVHALTLEREARLAISAEQADVSCSLVKLGSSKYRLKVFNRGKAVARNVRIELADSSDLVPESEVRRKFPMRVIEPGQAVELMAMVHMQTKSRHSVRLHWEDANGANQVKELDVTL